MNSQTEHRTHLLIRIGKILGWIFFSVLAFVMTADAFMDDPIKLWLSDKGVTNDHLVLGSLGLILLVTFVVLALNYFRRQSDKHEVPEFDELYIRNKRENYLDHFFDQITTHLENDIHHACYQEIELKTNDTLAKPWHFIKKTSKRFGDKKQKHYTIEEILDKYLGGGILLLGGPGSGKTTTLNYIALKFLSAAKSDLNAQIPVILNLSQWGKNARSKKGEEQSEDVKNDPLLEIESWIAHMLLNTDGIKLDIELTQKWIKEEKFIYLLDGLDEANEDNRIRLVERLNTFLSTRANIPLVLCLSC